MLKTVFARANTEKVFLSETYRYEQEISRSSSMRILRKPEGVIAISVPYDGYDYFTRQAISDVEKQLTSVQSTQAIEALIGHLVLANYGRTDLNERLNLSAMYGSIPLCIPVRGNGLSKGEALHSDQLTCSLHCPYEASEPYTSPIDVEMQLLDEEILADQNADLDADTEQRIVQQIQFSSSLLLVIRVMVHLPGDAWSNGLSPRVARVSLGWPTLTSIHGLKLLIGKQEMPLIYNPGKQALEWMNVAMEPEPKVSGDGLRTYTSKPMTLLIDQPGEFYRQQALSSQMEVEIGGQLLSGLQVYLFNGIGAAVPASKLDLKTNLIADVNLILDDAFAGRILSPYQHLHFDQIIPTPMRITDILTTLKDRGFLILLETGLRSETDHVKHFILAERPEGPDKIKFWVFIEGKRFKTLVQTTVGNQVFTTNSESGELKIDMRGQLPRDSRVLVQEMNAFGAALRDRFMHQQARN